eukprot:Hpha_TRINITY_DN15757_c2_g8::TRINITY_DN15757_c2_g8_i1::g.37594::m.37594
MLRLTLPRFVARKLVSKVARGLDMKPLMAFYKEHGYVVVPNVLDKDMQQNVVRWVKEIEDNEGMYMNQHETTLRGERVLCRSEYLVNHHKGIRELIVPHETSETFVPEIVSTIHGRDIKLYKEKINYKYPHTGAYRPHQDITAYPGSKNHVTCLISLCDTSTKNGCLEFAKQDKFDKILPNTNGIIHDDVVASLEWTPVPTSFGDLVLFNSYVAHRSGVNTTEEPRKALYLTYNDAAEGDLREAYYEEKRRTIGDGKISLIDHYAGDVLRAGDPAAPKLPAKLTSEDAVVAEISHFFDTVGEKKYDDHITQLEHALQTAEYAKKEGESEEFQLSCFLHDIGHLILDEHSDSDTFLEKDLKHETVGFLYLKRYFPEQISTPPMFHVLAKRYLCTVDEDYYDKLSSSSKRSFEVQGGFLSEEELGKLEGNAHFMAAVRLRRYEDASKTENNRNLSIDKEYCEGLIRKHIRL